MTADSGGGSKALPAPEAARQAADPVQSVQSALKLTHRLPNAGRTSG
jgi:hypothetical protein